MVCFNLRQCYKNPFSVEILGEEGGRRREGGEGEEGRREGGGGGGRERTNKSK